MFNTNRSIFKKILQFNIKNFENMGFCRIGARSRNYSQSYSAMPLLKSTLEQEEFEKYKSHIYYIIEYLEKVGKGLPKTGNQRLRSILNYNLTTHIQDTGPLVVSTYRQFVDPEKLTSDSINVAYTIAWAYDMIIRGYQIIDDLMDSSETRNNKPCWHQIENIGLKAVNDALVMVEASFMLTRNHLFEHPSYLPILELTNDTKCKIILGQMLDVNLNFELFTVEQWKTLAKYKGTFGGVIDPIARGMYLAEVFDKKLHYEVQNVLIELGEYFTAQNDMLDLYGRSTITGKHGNDIPEGKCTWLAVQALADANSYQRQLFKMHYGKSHEDSQKVIEELYYDLNLYEKFLLYEEELYIKLNGMIEILPEAIPKEFMFKVIDAYFGKTKYGV